MGEESDRVTDQQRMLFGAGFVSGVVVTMLLLAVSLVVTARGQASVDGAVQSALVTVGAGVLFAGIVGAGLFSLAFPENRTEVPVDPEQFGLDEK
ncbi:hypothetical protein BRC92_10920 [Halobacteriales archaeon QS_4_69_31]|nr:MAG: hypothetical protein BRC92_10920 [Halobacteriales archaeon QS_4_69_31]